MRPQKPGAKGEAMKSSNLLTVVSRIMLVIACVALTATAHANLLVNGSFEQPGGYFGNVPVGATFITGWVVTRGTIDYSPGWQCPDGVASVDLDGSPGSTNNVGGVSQTFATVPSQQYQVTFAMAINPDNNTNNQLRVRTMDVQAAGQSTSFTLTELAGTTDANMNWIGESWTFTATNSSTTIEFFSTDAQNTYFGPTLDNVIVAPVPEPSTIFLTALGLITAYVIRRR
jgi:choice-of-anchor C domain-containing protein